MNPNKVLRIQNTILILYWNTLASWLSESRTLLSVSTDLTCSIDNLGGKFSAFVLDDFAECVFNGRVVALHKVAVDKLDRQRRFAYTMVSIVIAATLIGLQTGCLQFVGGIEKIIIPTERLPTMAILRCFGGVGILAFQWILNLFCPLYNALEQLEKKMNAIYPHTPD